MTESVPAARRRTAHDHRQLADALGWTAVQIDKALALGVLPPHDLKTPRWTAATVDALLERREELAAALDEGALRTMDELMVLLRLDYGAWLRGREHGVIPGPDRGEFWSGTVAEDLAARAERLREQIPAQPLGLRRCAELLAELTGLEVVDDDVRALIEQGHIPEAGWYKSWPLFDTDAVRQLGTTPDGAALVTTTVADRQAWLAESVTSEDAARWLGWNQRDLARLAAEQGVTPGRAGRWARVDIARLADDEDLAEQLRGRRLLGPDQAAAHLEARRRDFDYCVAAGWIRPAQYTQSHVSRRRWIDVPLYQTSDVEALRDIPGVDWEAVRAAKPGDPSPLREFTALPIARAVLVRGFAADLAERHGITVTAVYSTSRDQWQLRWATGADGQPSRQAVRAAIDADRGLATHSRAITLHPTEANPQEPPSD